MALSVYDLKPAFQNSLRGIVNKLAKMSISANQVTMSSIVLSIITGIIVATGNSFPYWCWFVPFALFIRMALNAIDGMLAREHNMKSDMGMYMNEMGDVISDIAIYAPFAMINGINAIIIMILMALTFFSELAGVLGPHINASRRYDGPMGKSDRATLFSVICILIGFGINPQSSVLFMSIINGILIITGILLVITIKNRIFNALEEVKEVE